MNQLEKRTGTQFQRGRQLYRSGTGRRYDRAGRRLAESFTCVKGSDPGSGSLIKKANRLFHPEDSVIDVSGVKVGGQEKIVVIGGPCSVEGEAMICDIAQQVKDAGGVMLRARRVQTEEPHLRFQEWASKGFLQWVKARGKDRSADRQRIDERGYRSTNLSNMSI